ncbi:MAG: hypothetical protein QOK29_2367 [Rhodospirillaceae bacterium]|jgi:hypothetical protein|nr:hypothetical protein [Rhodospirillaceae bacterium]
MLSPTRSPDSAADGKIEDVRVTLAKQVPKLGTVKSVAIAAYIVDFPDSFFKKLRIHRRKRPHADR